MATTSTNPRELDQAVLLRVLTEFKRGNFNVRMPDDWTGTEGKIDLPAPAGERGIPIAAQFGEL